MRRLFALDHKFPDPIVSVLAGFQSDAELVRIDQIDPRLAEVDDWQLLLALHHDERPWDGLITTDSSMTKQAPELATLIQTKLSLVVAEGSGHNPVKASGLLFAHLGGICQRTDPSQPQLWVLRAVSRPAQAPWDALKAFAEHNNRKVDDVWREHRLAPDVFETDPLSG